MLRSRALFVDVGRLFVVVRVREKRVASAVTAVDVQWTDGFQAIRRGAEYWQVRPGTVLCRYLPLASIALFAIAFRGAYHSPACLPSGSKHIRY